MREDRETMDFECELKLADVASNAEGTIEGYASVFGILDQGGDIVMPGAFKTSLKEWKHRKSLPPLLWQHDTSQPIGNWNSITEDEKGLKVSGELILDVPMGKTAHILLKRNAVRGLSVGYRARESETDRATGARQISKADLWEVSLVTIPMLREAAVESVKAMGLPTDREMEEILREADFSREGAKAGVRAIRLYRKSFLREEGPQSREARDLLMTIRKATAALR